MGAGEAVAMLRVVLSLSSKEEFLGTMASVLAHIFARVSLRIAAQA